MKRTPHVIRVSAASVLTFAALAYGAPATAPATPLATDAPATPPAAVVPTPPPSRSPLRHPPRTPMWHPRGIMTATAVAATGMIAHAPTRPAECATEMTATGAIIIATTEPQEPMGFQRRVPRQTIDSDTSKVCTIKRKASYEPPVFTPVGKPLRLWRWRGGSYCRHCYRCAVDAALRTAPKTGSRGSSPSSNASERPVSFKWRASELASRQRKVRFSDSRAE